MVQPTNPVQEMLLNEASNVIDQLYSAAVEGASDVCARMPEPIFVQSFLPFFAGQVTRESRPDILATWISIAGSPTAKVIVVDQAGRELFSVPGVFDTSFLTLARGRRGTNYSDIVDHSNLLSNNIPKEGARYMTEALQDKFQLLEKKNAISTNEQLWVNIFNRYNIQVPGYEDKSAINQTQDSALSDEEY